MLPIPAHLPRVVNPSLRRVRNLLKEPRVPHRHRDIPPSISQHAQPLHSQTVVVHGGRVAAREPIQRHVSKYQVATCLAGGGVEDTGIRPGHHLLADPREQAHRVAADHEARCRRTRAIELNESRAACEELARACQRGYLVGLVPPAAPGNQTVREGFVSAQSRSNSHIRLDVDTLGRRDIEHVDVHETTCRVQRCNNRGGCTAEVAPLNNVPG